MEQLISELLSKNVLKNKRVLNAFQIIDRKFFVPPELVGQAYEDHPLPIGKGQTISQPYTVAFMLELLDPQPGQNILDVGCGSGWTTALLAQIVGPTGKVFGVEIVPELVAFGRNNLKKFNLPQAKIFPASKKLGWSPEKEFDRILVSAAASSLPQELVNQLKPGGVMVIPIDYSVWRIEKTAADEIKTREFPGFVFVPLL